MEWEGIEEGSDALPSDLEGALGGFRRSSLNLAKTCSMRFGLGE
jgi:hypothetical protein